MGEEIMQRHKVILPILSILVILFAATNVMAVIKEHREIKGPFNTPSEVTIKCLECHDREAEDFMKTQHWKWEQLQVVNCEEMVYGKNASLTNFAITLKGNWKHCTSCHDGYGWQDDTFDFTDKTKIDCIGCHDTSGTYEKSRKGFGMPTGYEKGQKESPAVDLVKVAQSADKPTRRSCGRCHFGGCGAARVKHGDLDPSFTSPDFEIDIHMAGDGKNFNCQKCHYPQGKHDIQGHYMAATPEGNYQSGCLECHSDSPHRLKILNTHYEAVACQTCHIPTFARKYAAKTDWDWSTATRRKKFDAAAGGKGLRVKGMGAFTYNKDIIPIYEWFQGCDGAYFPGDKIDPNSVTRINPPQGDKDDPKAKIFPFKVHHGVQLYDKKYNYLITPLITEEAETSFNKSYDWDTAAREGMKINGLKYSGEYGFVDTLMYWRINHGVVPGNKALDCLECHGHNGRMDWEHLGYGGDPWEIPGLSRARHDFR
jgi:octaheme c-type cytochrome (tetrathionate reductase family)